jgi:preprotein translocase subunit SecG
MGLGGGQQMLFGGSGGQTMFEKITWALGIAFIFGALGLTIFKTKRVNESTLAGYRASSATMKADKKAAARHEANAPQEHKSESTK